VFHLVRKRSKTLKPPIRCSVYVWLFASIAFACSNIQEERALARNDDSLVVVQNRLWTENDFPLSVCFQTTGDGDAFDRGLVRNAVESTWASTSQSQIAFTDWGFCFDNDAGADIRIFLDSSVSRSGTFYGQGSASRRIKLRTSRSSNNANLKFAYVHEFGHALGLEHEQDHPDSTCTDERHDLVSSAVPVTPYDEAAVMNYCAPSTETLSQYEMMFGKLIYPDGSSLPISCKSGCFEGASERFMRTDGSIQDPFTAIGALAWWPNDSGALTWRLGGAALAVGATLNAEALGSVTAGTVTYGGVVTYTDREINGGGSIRVDNAVWTAIAMAAL